MKFFERLKQSVFLFKILSMLMVVCSVPNSYGESTAYALINTNVFNGIDNHILKNATILVEDGKIREISGAEHTPPDGFTVVDLEGYYLMPGLFDVHTHIDKLDQARRALESGVTTVRSASVPAFQDIALRELSRSGNIPGPDVVAAGVYVTPNLEGTILADPRLAELSEGVRTDDELRKLIQINIDRGVDVIKTRGTGRAGLPDTDPRKQVYSERQLRIIVDEATRHGVPVMVHAHGDEGARAAVLAGARSIEHGTYLSQQTLTLMKKNGTWLVPTYVTMDEMNEEQYDSVLRLRGKYMVPQLEKTIGRAIKTGVKIATGADNYYDEKSINRISLEVEHLVRLGMSHFQALQSATTSSAELLRLGDTTGRIVPGYEADMILLSANPLEHIEALQDVLLVMSNGRIVLNRIPFAAAN